MPRDFYRAEITLAIGDRGPMWAIDMLDSDGMSAHTAYGPTLLDAEHAAVTWIREQDEENSR